MKRLFLFFAAAMLLGFGLQSCDKEDNNGNYNGGNTATVQWVDLGLPSGLLWADRNLGAESPEDYGNYYAWGETAPKEDYNWSTYAYGDIYSNSYPYVALTKYCSSSYWGLNGFTDNLTALVASDDAATVNLGSGAHTPTKDEWDELLSNTTSTWTTRNGVNGCLLTASNGKSLFLPAAGQRTASGLRDLGKQGRYWSSTLDIEHPSYAWFFDFNLNCQDMIRDGRPLGFSVRAVCASQN